MSTNTENITLTPGNPAPQFTLHNQEGNPVSLSDYAGKKVMIYFYPKADTPGCTKEACDFRDNLSQFNSLGIDVLGISPDKPVALKKFQEKYNLNFPLLSDEDKSVMKEYGAYGQKNSYGRLIQGVIRSTFLVDEQQNIEAALYNVKATGHVARMLRDQDAG